MTYSEEWRHIPDFPNYCVSNWGRVRNEDSGRVLALMRNQHGVCNVGMMRKGVQYKRSVTLLVASVFLDPHPLEAFDTPINLDGNRENNMVHNLEWRPRWFAAKYHAQFKNKNLRTIFTPIVEVKTGERFENSFEAAVKYGLLDTEIALAILNNTYVWPTYQVFRPLEV